MKKFLSILLLVSMLIVCMSSCSFLKYKDAYKLIDNGDYEAAYDIFCELGDYKNAEDEVEKFHYLRTSIVYEEEYEDEKRTKTITISLNEQNLPSQAIATSDKGDKYIYDYTYDENGNLIKGACTHLNGYKSITDYTYDEKGNLINVVKTDSDGNKYIYNLAYKFVYIPFDFSSEDFFKKYLTFAF